MFWDGLRRSRRKRTRDTNISETCDMFDHKSHFANLESTRGCRKPCQGPPAPPAPTAPPAPVEQGGSCICTTEALGVWLQWMFTGKGGGYSSPWRVFNALCLGHMLFVYVCVCLKGAGQLRKKHRQILAPGTVKHLLLYHTLAKPCSNFVQRIQTCWESFQMNFIFELVVLEGYQRQANADPASILDSGRWLIKPAKYLTRSHRITQAEHICSTLLIFSIYWYNSLDLDMSRHSNLMNFMDIRQQMLQRLRGESLFAYRIPDAFRARASESPVAASSLLILKSEVSTCCQCHCILSPCSEAFYNMLQWFVDRLIDLKQEQLSTS